MKTDNLKAELKIIEAQLGRVPTGVKAIVSYCKYGFPQVIQNECFVKGVPFPTLFWLTCPLLVKAVSKIEGQGWSDIIRAKIDEDAGIKQKLLAAHDNYRQMRIESSVNESLTWSEVSLDHAVFSTGVGGVRDDEGVKCLHAHYAHYLATGDNPLGEMVDKVLVECECERRCSE